MSHPRMSCRKASVCSTELVARSATPSRACCWAVFSTRSLCKAAVRGWRIVFAKEIKAEQKEEIGDARNLGGETYLLRMEETGSWSPGEGRFCLLTPTQSFATEMTVTLPRIAQEANILHGGSMEPAPHTGKDNRCLMNQ